MKDGRKMFFSALLGVLLVISNIVAIKMTVVAKLPLSCSIFVYPFTFLCTSVITELYGSKDARKSVFFALLIQVIVLIAYIAVINVPNQIDTIEQANSLQRILTPFGANGNYYPELRPIIASLVAFVISQLINIVVYTFSKKYTFKLIAVALSVIIAMIVDTSLYVFISQAGLLAGNELILALINRFVANVVASVVVIILFMIFSIKKKEVKEVKIEEKN